MMKALLGTVLSCLALTVSFTLSAQVRQYRVNVVEEYPHDVTSYTQGLFFHEGQMYESTGQNGSSTFRKVDIETGKPLRKLDFARKYFVEGSVVLDGYLYILTWTSKVAFIYDIETLEYRSTVSYPRQGWGLTTDGESLIASDGSSRLFFLDRNLNTLRSVQVRLRGKPLNYLNELEYIDGKIWANVYTTNMIAIIDPESGNVEGVVDCSGLLPDKLKTSRTDVLNGIAYDGRTGNVYLTGKNWPRLYQVQIEEKK